MKKFIFFIGLIVLLLIAGTALMFFTKWCPPQGPWPTPPWCASPESRNFSPKTLSYIAYPEKTKADFKLGIGTMDIWGNPHMYINLGEDTTKLYRSALTRIGAIKSNTYLFTDFINLGTGTEITSFDQETFPATFNISQDDLKAIVREAHANGQERIFMLTNLSDTANEISGFIASAEKEKNLKEIIMGKAFEKLTSLKVGLTSADALKKFSDKEWNEFLKNLRTKMLSQATKAQAAGVTDFIINPGDVIIENYYNKDLSSYWKESVTEIKKVFKGRVGYFGYPQMMVKINANDFDFVVVYFEVNGDAAARTLFTKTELKPEALRGAWQQYFDQAFLKNISKEKILLVTIPSYTGVKNKGWIEPGEMHGDLTRDDKEQALLYEALLEANMQDQKFSTIISYGYWWSANMYPQSKPLRNDLSHSIRNKDAEQVFYHWAQ